jgi:hypothetical protein
MPLSGLQTSAFKSLPRARCQTCCSAETVRSRRYGRLSPTKPAFTRYSRWLCLSSSLCRTHRGDESRVLSPYNWPRRPFYRYVIIHACGAEVE